TTIARVAAGLSGAGVYRVDASGTSYVLKVTDPAEPQALWQRRIETQQAAADAGLAPPIVHMDAGRRAVVTEFVVDRSFPMLLMTPATRAAAVDLLGRTLRRVHDIPLPPEADGREARDFLIEIWSGVSQALALPSGVAEVVQHVIALEPPVLDRSYVMSHNDVNPSNMVYDGERLLLLDWDTAGPNDPYFDLATIAVFFRLDDDTCLALLSAHDDHAVTTRPARFDYNRRLAPAMVGTIFLHLARSGGHVGATHGETLDGALTLSEFYQQMRAGALNAGTPDGQWAFGLALLKASASLA
ncbi:MAG: phosphotransferase, partial [Gemmatimonadaceae bacterium]